MIPCNPMQYHAIPCNTIQYHAIPCNTMQYNAIPCNSMQYHVVPCNTVQYHSIPCIIMQYHATPCNTMQYQAIQCNTMQYHTSFITADGAYHCPVGSIWPFLYLAGDLMTCGTFFFLFLFVCQSQRMWPWQVHLEPATSRFLDYNLRYRSLLHILPAVLETRR